MISIKTMILIKEIYIISKMKKFKFNLEIKCNWIKITKEYHNTQFNSIIIESHMISTNNRKYPQIFRNKILTSIVISKNINIKINITKFNTFKVKIKIIMNRWLKTVNSKVTYMKNKITKAMNQLITINNMKNNITKAEFKGNILLVTNMNRTIKDTFSKIITIAKYIISMNKTKIFNMINNIIIDFTIKLIKKMFKDIKITMLIIIIIRILRFKINNICNNILNKIMLKFLMSNILRIDNISNNNILVTIINRITDIF